MRRFLGRFDEVIGFDPEADNPPPTVCVYVPVDIASDGSVGEGLTAIREHHGSRGAGGNRGDDRSGRRGPGPRFLNVAVGAWIVAALWLVREVLPPPHGTTSPAVPR